MTSAGFLSKACQPAAFTACLSEASNAILTPQSSHKARSLVQRIQAGTGADALLWGPVRQRDRLGSQDPGLFCARNSAMLSRGA